MKMKTINLKKRLLPLAMTATVLLAGTPVSALELTIDGDSAPAYLTTGIPVTLQATASIGAVETEFFVDGVSVGKGTETANESGVFTMSYTPTKTGSQRISAVERMAQGGIGKADEVRVYAQTLVENVLDMNFNSSVAGSVAKDDHVWDWSIPAVATVDDAHGVSLNPTTKTEWNMRNIHNHKTAELIVDLDFYLVKDFCMGFITNGGHGTEDFYVASTGVRHRGYTPGGSTYTETWNKKAITTNAWHTLKVVVDIAALTQTIYIDDIAYFENVHLNHPAKNAILTANKYLQRFWVTSWGNAYIDNLKLRLVQPATEITDISYQDGSFSVTLKDAADVAGAENAIRLLRVGDSEGEATPVSITATGRTLTVTPTIPLQQSSTYRLVIAKELMAGNKALNRDYLYTIDTPAGGDVVLEGKFHQGRVKLNTAAGLKAGDEVSFSGKLVHAQDAEVWVAIAAYQKQADGTAEMVACKMKELSLTASDGDSLIVTLPLTEDLAEGAYLKAYVWKKSGLQPYSNAFLLEK